jgi:hypothetical protein
MARECVGLKGIGFPAYHKGGRRACKSVPLTKLISPPAPAGGGGLAPLVSMQRVHMAGALDDGVIPERPTETIEVIEGSQASEQSMLIS